MLEKTIVQLVYFLFLEKCLTFLSNRLFIPSQSGFLPGDSCIVQLLSIIHGIQTGVDENFTVDVRGVF